MYGPNGKTVKKISWSDFKHWQRWDEWTERIDNPPLTTEMVFWYENKQYMITTLQSKYVIVSLPEFNEIISNNNFLELLNTTFINGHTFKELLSELLFEV